jgi:hypothetical protein
MRMTVHSFDFIGVVIGFNGTQHQKLNAVIVGSGLCGEGIYPLGLRSGPEMENCGVLGTPHKMVYDCFAAERG